MPLDPSVLTNGKVIIGRIALAIYIDDLLMAGKGEAHILRVKELLKAQFEVKNFSEVQMVLNIVVRQYSHQMTLNQS